MVNLNDKVDHLKKDLFTSTEENMEIKVMNSQ